MAAQAEQAVQNEAAIRRVMTTPELLDEYVLEFHGPNGPYPVEDKQEDMNYYNYRQQPSQDPRVTPDGAGLDSTTSRLVNPMGYSRPEFPAPPQSMSGERPDISVLSYAVQQDPSTAWQVVDYLQNSGAFRNTVLAMDS